MNAERCQITAVYIYHVHMVNYFNVEEAFFKKKQKWTGEEILKVISNDDNMKVEQTLRASDWLSWRQGASALSKRRCCFCSLAFLLWGWETH